MNPAALCPEPDVLARSRAADYFALTKPRVAVLVLFTVAAGAFLAGGPAADPLLVFHAVVGTALVAAGASALNQLLERNSDALMRRTETRPLPAGRLQAGEVLAFGILLGVVGVAYLGLALGDLAAPLLAAFTFVAYVCVYTPLKRHSTANTLIGAVPGALPPVIGWVAVRGTFDAGAWTLFLIVFVWQVPHFLAIAWIYREDYGRAGLKMLPVADPKGILTARHMVLYCLTLVPASLIPVFLGSAGVIYLCGALLLGLWFLASAVEFARARGTTSARRVLKVSLGYLPGLFVLLLLDNLIL